VILTGSSVSSTNKTDRRNITEILFKVALSTIKKANKNNKYFTSSLSLQAADWDRQSVILTALSQDKHTKAKNRK